MVNSTYDNSASSEEGQFSAVATGLTNLDLANNNNASSETTGSTHEASSNVDVEMSEVSNNGNVSETKVDERSNLSKLTIQLNKLANVYVSLSDQKIDLYVQGVMDENDVRLKTIARQCALIEQAQADDRVQIDAIVKLNHKLANNESQIKNRKPTILPKDVPIFNVDPSANMLTNSNSVNTEELSLSTFLLQFERVFSANSVDIEKHWLYYLEISFEQAPKYYSWFTVNLKNSSNVSWSAAKNLLKQRFDLASQASAHSLITNLVSFTCDENESFILCLERFRMLVIASQVKFDDNILLIYLFIKCFRKQVQCRIYS